MVNGQENEPSRQGRRRRKECLLTPEQRQVLGTDQFFKTDEVAAFLGVSEENIRKAVAIGSLPGYLVKGGRREVLKVKGWRVIIWRDRLAGISDGDEQGFVKV